MNFFGHALVAAHKRPDPRFVLGSMLPDFAAMLRLRLPEVGDDVLADGVAFHHATDRAFHESPTFRTLNLRATRYLDSLGVRRGTVRAVAHVGVEYMIDGELAELLKGNVAHYHNALAHGARLESGDLFANTEQEVRFRGLLDDLRRRGASAFTGGVNTLVFRLVRALGSRPRLSISEADLPRVASWANTQAGQVATAMPALLAELAEALGLALAAGKIR